MDAWMNGHTHTHTHTHTHRYSVTDCGKFCILVFNVVKYFVNFLRIILVDCFANKKNRNFIH